MYVYTYGGIYMYMYAGGDRQGPVAEPGVLKLPYHLGFYGSPPINFVEQEEGMGNF
jgi:hypothetical protein